MDEVMTVEQAAEFLKLKPSTVYAWVQANKLPYHKVGGVVRFMKEELLNFVKSK